MAKNPFVVDVAKFVYITRKEGIVEAVRRLLAKVRRKILGATPCVQATKPFYLPTEEELSRMKQVLKNFRYQPLVSIIVPVYNTRLDLLDQMIRSVVNQVYDKIELCICNDGSRDKKVGEFLDQWCTRDSRIKVVHHKRNMHISAASNSALKLATGEFVALVDHDDVLPPHAIYKIVELLNNDRNADIIYTNEDKISEDGVIYEPTFKPKWSPNHLLSFMYVGHLTCYRKALVDEVGGFREGYEGSQDYDLLLRAAERTDRIRHISDVCYHWRAVKGSAASDIGAKLYAFRSANKALNDALRRRGLSKVVKLEDGKFLGTYRIKPLINVHSVPVTAVFYGKDRGRYSNMRKFFEQRIRSVGGNIIDVNRIAELTNFSNLDERLNEYAWFIDTSVDDFEGGWLEHIFAHVIRHDIGIISPMVMYDNNNILSTGRILIKGLLYHDLFRANIKQPPFMLRRLLVHEVIAPTSVFGVRKNIICDWIKEVPAYDCFDFYLLDLSFFVRKRGLEVIVNPESKVFSRNSAITRYVDLRVHVQDLMQFQRRWGKLIEWDPYYPEGMDESLTYTIKEAV